MAPPKAPVHEPDRHLQLEDVDLARTVFQGLYQGSKVEVHRDVHRRFAWSWKINPRGTATIIRGQASQGGVTITGALQDFVLATSARGSLDLSSCGQRADLRRGQMAAVVNPGVETSVVMPVGARTLNIRIDPSALASHAAALGGAPMAAPPRFKLLLDLRGEAGADIFRLTQLLADACARPDSPLGSPHVIAHLREALYSALLVGHESSIHHLLQRSPPATDTRAVRQAEEILAARAAEPISMTEVAELTGIGLRSLERSFKAARGCSLRDFLKAQRLELAHRRLRAGAPGTTVQQILYASGFTHPGEFSQAYRKRFGEAPSETLRRSASR